jgi:hypothetical protein
VTTRQNAIGVRTPAVFTNGAIDAKNAAVNNSITCSFRIYLITKSILNNVANICIGSSPDCTCKRRKCPDKNTVSKPMYARKKLRVDVSITLNTSNTFPAKSKPFTNCMDLSKDVSNIALVAATNKGSKGGLSELAFCNAVPSKICRATSNRASVSGPMITPFLPVINNINITSANAMVNWSSR